MPPLPCSDNTSITSHGTPATDLAVIRQEEMGWVQRSVPYRRDPYQLDEEVFGFASECRGRGAELQMIISLYCIVLDWIGLDWIGLDWTLLPKS